MALTELELQRCKKALAHFLDQRRPPKHVRDQLDIGYRINDQTIEILEIRADWQDQSKKLEIPIAKATFVRTKNCWQIFWLRGNLKWRRYEPNPEVHSFDAFLDVVHRDQYCCFFG
jgi:hypothetical protein